MHCVTACYDSSEGEWLTNITLSVKIPVAGTKVNPIIEKDTNEIKLLPEAQKLADNIDKAQAAEEINYGTNSLISDDRERRAAFIRKFLMFVRSRSQKNN